jgi:hypothetical protein
MACEDSTSLDCCFDRSSRYSSYLRIHRIRDVHDFEKTSRREVIAAAHTIQDVFDASRASRLMTSLPSQNGTTF